jgi:hypothetical protein
MTSVWDRYNKYLAQRSGRGTPRATHPEPIAIIVVDAVVAKVKRA